jgi:hypothetical protein
MPHHNHSIRERVIALLEEGKLTAAEAGRRYGVPVELRGGGSSGIWYLGKLVGALVRDFGVSSRLVDKARENPFLNSVQLKRNTVSPVARQLKETA